MNIVDMTWDEYLRKFGNTIPLKLVGVLMKDGVFDEEFEYYGYWDKKYGYRYFTILVPKYEDVNKVVDLFIEFLIQERGLITFSDVRVVNVEESDAGTNPYGGPKPRRNPNSFDGVKIFVPSLNTVIRIVDTYN